MEIPISGIKPIPHQWPKPLQGQWWALNLLGYQGTPKHLFIYMSKQGDQFETNVLSPAIFNILKFILDNTARILTRKNGFNRHEISTYLLPVVISDNDYPIQSSTGTLTIRVCACDSQGNMQSCSAEALLLPAGLSTGALIAILLCIIILLGKKL